MYAKIFAQVFDSTLADNWKHRHVFEDLLKLADKHGRVDMTPEAISRRTRMPLRMVLSAIEYLSGPDPRSRTKDYEGRRLIPIDPERSWGWVIVNYLKYRDINTEVDRSMNFRGLLDGKGYVYYAVDADRVKIGWSKNPWSRVTEMRTANPSIRLLATERGSMTLEKERHKQFAASLINLEWFKFDGNLKEFIDSLIRSNDDSPVVTTNHTVVTTSASASASALAHNGKGGTGGKPEPAAQIYAAYPRKVGRPAAMKAILKHLDAGVPAEAILACTEAYAKATSRWSEADRCFIPHPATWFNQERFNDDPSTWERNGHNNDRNHTRRDGEGGHINCVTGEWEPHQ